MNEAGWENNNAPDEENKAFDARGGAKLGYGAPLRRS
jgi:hypothetical protein